MTQLQGATMKEERYRIDDCIILALYQRHATAGVQAIGLIRHDIHPTKISRHADGTIGRAYKAGVISDGGTQIVCRCPWFVDPAQHLIRTAEPSIINAERLIADLNERQRNDIEAAQG